MSSINPVIESDCHHIIETLGPLTSRFAGKTVLITGAQGFLCSYLVDALAIYNAQNPEAACRIIVLDNFITGRAERLAHLEGQGNVVFITHDITKPLFGVFDPETSIDFIVHGASIASPMVYREFPLETLDANITGTRNVLELAKHNKSESVLVMSSSEVYGNPDPTFIPTSEEYWGNTSFTGPRACYDESKRVSETICAIYADKHNIPVKMARPFNVYGPGLRLDDKRVMPDFLNAVLSKTPITLLSDGSPTRTFCYISDAVRAMFHILLEGQEGEPYNMGVDQGEISMYDLAVKVADIGAKVMGMNPLKVTREVSKDTEYLTDNPQRRCPNLRKIRSQTGYTPQISLERGIELALRSYLQDTKCENKKVLNAL